MERYEYERAAEEFEAVLELAPDWQAAKVNLAIALLNQTGKTIEEEQDSGGAVEIDRSQFDRSLALLDQVIAEDPDNLHAHFCKGIVLDFIGEWKAAYDEFRFVAEREPSDAIAWRYVAKTMPSEKNPNLPASGAGENQRLIPPLENALEANPYLVPAIYDLAMNYARTGQTEKAQRLMKRRAGLNRQRPDPPPGLGDSGAQVYGEMGRYAEVIGPKLGRLEPAGALEPPQFDGFETLEIDLPEGHRWAAASDFEGGLAWLGRFRDRFGASVTAFDADGDGDLDLYLCAAVIGPDGPRDILLVNEGDGRFLDATERFGLSTDHPSLAASAADYDADFHIDLYLCRLGPNQLWRNTGEGAFEDATEATGTAGPNVLSLSSRWLDLDMDGDLDLYVVNHDGAEDAEAAFEAEGDPPAGATNLAFRNDGVPAMTGNNPRMTLAPLAVEGPDAVAVGGLLGGFTQWPDAEPLFDAEAPHTAVAVLDLEDDRDLDLVLAADGEPLRAVINDRLGAFRTIELEISDPPERINGLAVSDLDRDGYPDLIAVGPSGVRAWRNATTGRGENVDFGFEPWPIDAPGWRSAVVADLDLDGWLDLMATSLDGEPIPTWARNEGDRLAPAALPIAPPSDPEPALAGGVLVDLVGDALPDPFHVRDGAAPVFARNQGNGRHWLAIDLDGRWNINPKLMRSNPHGWGAKVALEGAGLAVSYHHTTPSAAPGQSVAPFVLGVGDVSLVPLIRLRWPDGVLQAEMNTRPDQFVQIAETSRKTGSCPVLFTWNGERFVCFGDFLGGGGMGYLVAPGVHGQPDRNESVHLRADQLEERGGAYRISIIEPMDEVAYLDHLKLQVVDRPPGVNAHPDERFAPGGNRPTGELLAWTETIEPLRATDLEGRDVTEQLKAWDRLTVDDFARSSRWVGYAEEHGIVLDFGDRLSAFGPEAPLILCLAGWVEYPYSQTNYAASTAGVSLEPPVLERLEADGTWTVIEPDPGYPAGLPRMTTLELTPAQIGAQGVIRLRTNMECYWDQAFLAVRDREAEANLRVKTLEVSRAKLGHRGYLREVSPDGELPLLYDYRYVDPVPLAPFAGRLTRYGDVTGFLDDDDDLLCLVGPGDEALVEFDAADVPELPEGWTRSYVLKSYGYCKDADPFTAGSDHIEPLPWRGMPDDPFPIGTAREVPPEIERAQRASLTRPAGRGN